MDVPSLSTQLDHFHPARNKMATVAGSSSGLERPPAVTTAEHKLRPVGNTCPRRSGVTIVPLIAMLADSAGLPSHDDAVRVQLSAKRDRRQTLSARSREWLFAGFTCVTGSETKEEDRGEAYYWVRRTLVREGLVVNKHRGNHNFGIQDLTRILLAFWTYDDLVFIHDRYRMQVVHVPHARLLCNRVGVWINAFFADGLRYWRVDADGGWRLVYQLDQRWVKNNRDIENGT
ncbi:hypothetical protein AYO22_11704 [Fonsecaea multimorphosa]|nr:hypothetical protein AYO22_11704 [Fonsecaea multimorphosa]